MELTFKNWLEDIQQVNPVDVDKDPTLSPVAKSAQIAMQDAIKRGKNPVKAVQDSIAKSKVPMNKLGQIMPTDPTTTGQ